MGKHAAKHATPMANSMGMNIKHAKTSLKKGSKIPFHLLENEMLSPFFGKLLPRRRLHWQTRANPACKFAVFKKGAAEGTRLLTDKSKFAPVKISHGILEKVVDKL